MKAVVFDGNLKLSEVPKPAFDGKESVVRMVKAGICDTDLEITRGYFGFQGVLGHEFVGVVEESKDSSWVGQRVVGEINAACGECNYCRNKLQRHCPHRTVLGILKRDGSFREFFTLPEGSLHRVPDSVSNEEAVFTEPIAAACEILDQVRIEPEQEVVILGDGKLGLLVAMVLGGRGRRLSLIGKHPEKMKLVQDLNVNIIELKDASEFSRGFDVLVEVTGSPKGWDLALRLIRPRGTIVLKSTFHDQIAFNPAPIVVDEITVMGSRCGRFEVALELLESKRIDPRRLVSATLPLSQALDAFQLAQKSEVLKVVLQP